MKIITKRPDGSIRVTTKNEEPSLAQQQFKDTSDINKIMQKYHATGMITHLNRKKGQYADLSQITDYQSALHLVMDANKAFMTLPSGVRKKFANDPQQVINFLADPKNKQEAIELGLIDKPKNDDQTTIKAPDVPKA